MKLKKIKACLSDQQLHLSINPTWKHMSRWKHFIKLLLRYCSFWPSCLGIKWKHSGSEGWGEGEATSVWPFYYEPAGRFVLKEAQQLLHRDVLPAESQCSPKCRKRSQPDWQNLWPRSVSVLGRVSVCVCGVAVGGAEGPMNNHPCPLFHSGRPAVGGGNLHASVDSNRYRHILLLKITLGTVNMWKIILLPPNKCLMDGNVW